MRSARMPWRRLRRQARCPVCLPLFSQQHSRRAHRPDVGPDSTGPDSTSQRASAAIKRMVGIAGCGTRRFSGVLARKGGLSAAIEAGVIEVILYLSGHGPERAARNYVYLREPARPAGDGPAWR